MAVVARVLLDHVRIDPPQRDLVATTGARVVETMFGSHLPAGHALAFPYVEVSVPVGVVERDQLAVLHVAVQPDVRRIGGAAQRSLEPSALDLGHVPDKSVQRKPGGG